MVAPQYNIHDNNKYTAANGQMKINVVADNSCQVTIIHYAQNFIGRAKSSVINVYGFMWRHIIEHSVHLPYGFID